MNEYKARYAAETDRRTLADAMLDADVFIGLSVANCLAQEMVREHGARPHHLCHGKSGPGDHLRRCPSRTLAM